MTDDGNDRGYLQIHTDDKSPPTNFLANFSDGVCKKSRVVHNLKEPRFEVHFFC